MSVRLIDDKYATAYYLITADDLGPLSESTSSVRQWLRKVMYFTLAWRVRVYQPDEIDVTDKCMVWKFNQLFDFTDRGLMTVKLRQSRYACEDSDSWYMRKLEDNMLWIPFAAIIISVISFIQLAMYFYGMSRQLQKLQKQYDKRIKEQKWKKEKLDTEAENGAEQKQMAQYKKTEIENRRFKLLQSGIDPVNINSTMEHARSRKDSSVSAFTDPNAATFVSNVEFTLTNEIDPLSETKNEAESSSSEDSDAPSEMTDRDDLDEE